MYRPIQRQWLGIWAFALLLVGLLHAVTAQAGMTLAGTVIKNLATVSYQDAAGNQYQATSNESIVTVAEVYAAELQQTQTQNGAAGQTVYFPHRLVNTGNVQDVFTLALKDAQDINLADLTIYRDVNGDGLPNAGEPTLTPGEKIFVAPGETANLVVAAVLSADITTSVSPSFKLQATAVDRVSGAQSWTDVNTDTIKVVTGAVLVATKEVRAHTPATDSIDGSVTYKITIRNNGSDLTANNNARIEDPLSSLLDVSAGNVTVGDVATGIKVDFIDSRFKADSFKVEAASGTEPYQHDFNALINIRELKAGSTLALEYTVTYRKDAGFVAGDVLKNIAKVIHHDGQVDTAVETNMTTVKLPQFYGVEAHNRDGASHQTHPGKIDTDLVTSIAKGEMVEFRALIKNTGNGTDRFALTIDKAAQAYSFPTDTKFTFWDSIGAVQYTDNKTPVLNHGQSMMVTIKAELPESVQVGHVDFTAELQANSEGDNSKLDKVLLKLKEITSGSAYGVDLSHEEKTANGENKDPLTDVVPAEGHQEILPGTTGAYTLWVRNESSTPRSFTLAAYKSVNGADRNQYTPGDALPAGWNVAFMKGNVPVNATGDICGSSETVNCKPSSSQSQQFEVLLTLPANIAVGSYEFTVLAQSQVNGKKVNDAIKYIVRVPVKGELTLTPDGQNQIEPGGAVFYEHILENTSNQPISGINLTGSSDLQAQGWSHLFFEVSNTGELGHQITMTDLSLQPGERKVFRVKVISPANAVAGSVDTLTLTATYPLRKQAQTATATDRTTVIKGQLRLDKSAAIIKGGSANNCQGTPGSFAVNPGKVEPGQDCVVWKIVARNAGDAKAAQVTIRDAAPEFTSLIAGSAQVVTQGMGEVVEADTTSGDVVFNIGHGATSEKNKGGTLNPGESVEVRFTVKVN